MTDMVSVVVLGFLLGMRHATDTDHVVAVATIVSRERVIRRASWIGALWGLGHTMTIVLVGTPIILFNWAVAPRAGLAMEFAVGLMLIILGLRNLTHPHAHDTDGSSISGVDGRAGHLSVYDVVRPLVVGIVHGLAGSAAIALLVLTTIHDARWAVAYLLVFGVGTVAGMILVTTAIAVPFAGDHGRSARSARTQGYIRTATGLLSLAFGLLIAYRIGITEGLFGPAPRWTPR